MKYKAPDATLDFKFDWSDWLNQNDSIQSSAWSVIGADQSLQIDGDTSDATTTTVVVSGGTRGHSYLVKNIVGTAGGLSASRSIIVKVQDRNA